MVDDLFWVYITTKDADEARTIGRRVVQERLAACCNIIDHTESFYWWDGELQHDTEAILIAKTQKATLQQLIEKIKSLHSYTCPGIEVLPVVSGNPDYLVWIRENT